MKISFKKIADYFVEVKNEVKKVNWPTRKETIKRTLMVIGITVLVAAFLGLLDFVFSEGVIQTLIKK
ncbi:MAG: preprotein translocase subunit SecE [Candidatus Paceibacterota bacterium]|jgi:preprotein translocase subunit SecE|nr:preprotein translocase subunit SecE [Candidatus Paceibacterota bacterium]MDD5621232.1 preprotein translocase subunit SecE [Candidatus Paceibacterota bacterium]